VQAGFDTQFDCRAIALITSAQGQVVGVRFKQGGRLLHVAARRGVVLATGGFQMNSSWVAAHLPRFTGNSEAIGIPYNDGAGIDLGIAAGGATEAMHAFNATACFYPPGQLIKGIIVNALGKRFVAEDSYHGRTAACILEQPGALAYLILDAEIFDYPQLKDFFQHTMIDGWETVRDMEQGLDLPRDSLLHTLSEFNADVKRGADSRLHKHSDWLHSVETAPYAAFDLSLNHAVYRFHSLGGLKVTAEAKVVSKDGHSIRGLYAAGACAAGIPQDSKGYASGMTLACGSLFGRIAGRHAASIAF
jgi:3-oxo-5alpha-steroid 4-dehydrogenase